MMNNGAELRSGRGRALLISALLLIGCALPVWWLVIRPGVVSKRINTNESAVIAMLKQLSSAQSQALASGAFDGDGNGAGEFADFRQMGEIDVLRLWTLGTAAGPTRVEFSGYIFELHLPPQTAEREVYWACYAWPKSFGETGHRVFFVNQRGDILTARNWTARYEGLDRTPTFGAAAFVEPCDGFHGRIAANTVGLDAETWVIV